LKEMKGKDLIIGLGKTEPTSHENSQWQIVKVLRLKVLWVGRNLAPFECHIIEHIQQNNLFPFTLQV
jgi:hypothetical protein